MSWLSRVRNRLAFLPRRQTAENLWHKCLKCGTMVFVKQWEGSTASARAAIFTTALVRRSHRPIVRCRRVRNSACAEVREDPLRFRDTKRYTDRLKAARAANGERDALVNARGRVDGHEVVIGVHDFAFMGGSMGIAVGAAFVAGVRAAIADEAPFILFTAAGGARMQEGT